MAFVPFTKDDQPTMAAFNEKFQQAIDEAVSRGVKIEVGSYVGTGTYGSSNPNTLTFEFEPKLVFVRYGENGTTGYTTLCIFVPTDLTSSFRMNGFSYIPNSTESNSYAKINGKSLSWYAQNSPSQANVSGKTYNYIAIG